MKLNLKKPALNTVATEPQTKSEFWLNIGYQVAVETDNGVEERFVSLPFGIPLDTMKPYEITTASDAFAYLRMAQNDLLEAIMEVAHSLKQGESKVISAGDQLAVEIRRTRTSRNDLKSDENPFARKLTF